MYIRKDLYPEEEFFDVSYYDSMKHLDQAT